MTKLTGALNTSSMVPQIALRLFTVSCIPVSRPCQRAFRASTMWFQTDTAVLSMVFQDPSMKLTIAFHTWLQKFQIAFQDWIIALYMCPTIWPTAPDMVFQEPTMKSRMADQISMPAFRSAFQTWIRKPYIAFQT